MKPTTVKELTEMGGRAKFKKYGKKGYSEMGKKGAAVRAQKYGPEYYYHIRQLGIQRRLEREIKEIQESEIVEEKPKSPFSAITNLFQGKK